jgi:hypothetical protein
MFPTVTFSLLPAPQGQQASGSVGRPRAAQRAEAPLPVPGGEGGKWAECNGAGERKAEEQKREQQGETGTGGERAQGGTNLSACSARGRAAGRARGRGRAERREHYTTVQWCAAALVCWGREKAEKAKNKGSAENAPRARSTIDRGEGEAARGSGGDRLPEYVLGSCVRVWYVAYGTKGVGVRRAA